MVSISCPVCDTSNFEINHGIFTKLLSYITIKSGQKYKFKIKTVYKNTFYLFKIMKLFIVTSTLFIEQKAFNMK